MAKEYSYHKQPILKMLEHIFLRCVPSRQGIEEVAEIHELEIISSGLVFMGQPDSTPRIVYKCAYLEIWLDLDRSGFYMFLPFFCGQHPATCPTARVTGNDAMRLNARLFAWSFAQFQLRPSEQHLAVPTLPGLITRALAMRSP